MTFLPRDNTIEWYSGGNFTGMNNGDEPSGQGKPVIFGTIAVLIIVLGLTVVYPGWWLTHYRAMDLPSYYVAGTLARESMNPYDPNLLVGAARALNIDDPIYPYIYFPMLALIFMPLSLLSYPVVQLLWFGLMQLFLWLSVIILYALIKPPEKDVMHPWLSAGVIAICGFSYPLIEDLKNGQINVLILFLTCAFLYSLRGKSDLAAGITLGLVGMIKPQPLLIAPYLLLVGRRRAGAAAIITFIVGTVSTGAVLGRQFLAYYIREVLPTFNMVKTSFPPIMNFAPPNQSIQGIVSRFFQNTRFSEAILDMPTATAPVSRGITGIILVLTVLALFRHRQKLPYAFDRVFRDSSLILVTSLIISPITWNHHLVLMAVTGVYTFRALTVSNSRCSWDFILVACWILIVLPLDPFNRIWAQNQFWNLGMSLKAYALLVFWGAFYFRFYRKSVSPAESNRT